MQLYKNITLVFLLGLFFQCKDVKKSDAVKIENTTTETKSVSKKVPVNLITEQPVDIETPEGMVWVAGSKFSQGAVAQDKMVMGHESPNVEVAVDGFFIDVTEVTNAQFSKFVKETGYITVAERELDWEEMKKQLPAGTPKPHDSIMQPGSLTFKKAKSAVANLYDFSQWWNWTIGASWKHPNGPGSSIKGLDNNPVVHIAYEDAMAYCEWSGHRLPTEAEWELAAGGANPDNIFTWGDDTSVLAKNANSWEGEFPVTNTMADGFESRAPVKSYPPNENGIYDMAGNVWEWTSDWYNTNYYKEAAAQGTELHNPQGASSAFNDRDPYAKEKVMKGGSFLCNASYCASYRISARMATSLDSSLEHLGFRTVVTPSMLANKK
ncbi:formylglycine-generating enzyme family protein [Aurantibacter crassamenti]|uniref:formylglycine-generating enzyme family protein n=1 Tax=Aurantibacter crassamenti TaxID=1837375 RepID=UPI00193A7357|nr:formylglycine-generating enzyme family protein [Aurantibacter crassamenti]MBM1107694.1 formylglycine-generating enzyme family protein [Aurantibacter crassamenti]